jgi:hypothetical protein
VIQKNENMLWKSLYTNRWHISDEALEGLKDWKTAYFDSFNRKYAERVQMDKRMGTALVVEKFAWMFTALVFICFMIFEVRRLSNVVAITMQSPIRSQLRPYWRSHCNGNNICAGTKAF